MRINRRNVLLGLGTMAVGGGAVAGSGAFSQVDVQRQVTIDVADDANALVGLSPSEDSDFVNSEGGKLVIDLSDSALDNASGVNIGGTISIDDAFTITNNHTGSIDVNIQTVTDSNIEISFDPEDITDLDSQGTQDVNITIDTSGASNTDTFNKEITITATQS